MNMVSESQQIGRISNWVRSKSEFVENNLQHITPTFTKRNQMSTTYDSADGVANDTTICQIDW